MSEFLRPESSVSFGLDEWGVEIFAGDRPGPVVHRTPEELGIPRVVPDVPVPRRLNLHTLGPSTPSPLYEARARARHHSTMRVPKLQPGRRRERLRTVKGVAVRMPAEAVMGAEMIDGFAAEAAKSMEEEAMPSHNFNGDYSLD